MIKKNLISDNWFSLLNIIDEDTFVSLMGADNAFYVLLIKLAANAFFVLFLLQACILCPIYYGGEGYKDFLVEAAEIETLV